jgi:HK97 family phage major capsid protein
MNDILNELKAAALLTAMENQRDGIEEVFSGKRKSLKLDLSDTKDMTFAGNFPTANASVATVRPGVVPLTYRNLHIRDLVPQGLMSGSDYVYINETTIPQYPTPIAEGAAKPIMNLTYTQNSAKANFVAGYMVVSRNMMDDIVAFASYLERRLPELILTAEDLAMINGLNGSALPGIIANSTASTTGQAFGVNSILADIGQLTVLERVPNGILLNDKTYFDILINSTNAAISTNNGQMFIAGIPVFKNPNLAVNRSIVGDWFNGANLIVRDPVRVEFFYQDNDNVRKNNVTVRVEERIAFPIFGNDYFVYKA